MLKYLLEIKNRLFLLFITYSFSILVLYYYKDILLFLVINPSFQINYKKDKLFYFIFTDVTEIFSIYLKLIIFISFQIFLIHFIYHSFLFFSPALFNTEFKKLRKILKFLGLIWFIVGLLVHYLVVPSSWDFFLSFQNLTLDKSFNLYFEAKLSEYFYFYISFYYICIFYLQGFFLLFFCLNYASTSIRKFRKLHYFTFVVLSTLICPDFITQILLSLTFIAVYEVFLFIFLFVNLKSKKIL
jgi:Sec-independent protein secretion pathway component TatC